MTTAKAEQAANLFEVRAGAQDLGGEAMTEHVRGDREREARGPGQHCDAGLHSPPREPRARLGQEERGRLGLAADSQPGRQRRTRGLVQGQGLGVPTLALHAEEQAGAQIHLVQVEGHQFGQSKPNVEQDRDQRGVPRRRPGTSSPLTGVE